MEEQEKKEKKTLAERYLALSSERKQLAWLIVVDLFVFVVLVPFFVLGLLSLSLGWLLGAVLSILTMLSMQYTSNSVFKKSSKPSALAFTSLFFILRFTLWAGVLIVAAICTFRPEWFGGFDLFSFYTCAAAYLPMPIITVIFSLKTKKEAAQ